MTRDELLAALEQSRGEMSGDLLDLRESLSVGRRVNRSYQRHTIGWLGGAAALGFLLARPLISVTRKGGSGRGEKVTRVGGVMAGTGAFLGKNAMKLVVPVVRAAAIGYLGRMFGAKPDDAAAVPKVVEEP